MEGEPSPNGYSVKRIGVGASSLVAVVLLYAILGRHADEWLDALWLVGAIVMYFVIAFRKPAPKG
jgi:hypothetical protein